MPDQTNTKLDDLLDEFQSDCEKSLTIYHSALELFDKQPDMFSEEMRNMLVEYIILQIFGKWERFLESIFIEYMLGTQSKNGEPVVKYVSPTNAEHAYQLVQNVNQYPDWADVDKVLKNARNFFENGGPFEILKTLKAEINALRKVRNAIAHTSKRAKQDFENLVQGKLGFTPIGITPAKFLIEHKTGRRRLDPTFCEHYIQYLSDTAKILVEFHKETNQAV